jgi:hypothetical protein
MATAPIRIGSAWFAGEVLDQSHGNPFAPERQWHSHRDARANHSQGVSKYHLYDVAPPLVLRAACGLDLPDFAIVVSFDLFRDK